MKAGTPEGQVDPPPLVHGIVNTMTKETRAKRQAKKWAVEMIKKNMSVRKDNKGNDL